MEKEIQAGTHDVGPKDTEEVSFRRTRFCHPTRVSLSTRTTRKTQQLSMSDDEMDITAAGMQGGDLTKDDAMMLGGGEDGDADSWAPLEVGQEKDLTKDGGVKKKLVHKGEGWGDVPGFAAPNQGRTRHKRAYRLAHGETPSQSSTSQYRRAGRTPGHHHRFAQHQGRNSGCQTHADADRPDPGSEHLLGGAKGLRGLKDDGDGTGKAHQHRHKTGRKGRPTQVFKKLH
jgi:hypothetical protein